MSARVGGIHHVTAIAGDPQANVDFYAGLLGMRLVKRSVNQDDPATYHLFYADGEGHPGSDLTFFPWPHAPPGRNGAGVVNEVVLAVPPGSLAFWAKRLADIKPQRADRFGEATLAFRDPHGLHVALAQTPRVAERAFTPWERSPIPVEHQIRGIHAVRIVVRRADPTREVAKAALGMRATLAEDGWQRFEGRDPASGYLELREEPGASPHQMGVGVVHHVAWRARDDPEQADLQALVRGAGLHATPVIDRFWFRSVYFREPGGVLFEIATDGPGFGVDEDLLALGERLVLPPWLEEERAAIEAILPPIELPHEAAAPRAASEARP